jgi:hypothetical protein
LLECLKIESYLMFVSNVLGVATPGRLYVAAWVHEQIYDLGMRVYERETVVGIMEFAC